MASSRDTSERLAQLEQILAQTTSESSVVPPGDADAAEVHLAGVPVERIRQLTAELRRSGAAELDEADAAAMKLLLNEYSTAVGHLRAVASLAAATIDAETAPMIEMERAVQRYVKTVDAHATDWLATNAARS